MAGVIYPIVHEEHQREQYFFDRATVTRLADIAARFDRPCCLCAPTVGRELSTRGAAVRVLDLDQRFADVRGFRSYDLYRPDYLDEAYGLKLAAPP